MLNIIRKSDDMFCVNVNDTSTKPLTINQLFKVMRELEVKSDEIDMAVQELVWNEHKIAHFGINRTFIYSK